MDHKGKKGKAQIGREWWGKLEKNKWPRWLSHGELRFIGQLVDHCNWGNFESRPGVRHIQEETGLDHKYQPLIAYRLWKLGILAGRSEYYYYGQTVWGYFLNPDLPEASKDYVSEKRSMIKAQFIPFNLRGGCVPTRAQLCALWAVTVCLPVLNPVTTSLQRTNEPSLILEKPKPEHLNPKKNKELLDQENERLKDKDDELSKLSKAVLERWSLQLTNAPGT